MKIISAILLCLLGAALTAQVLPLSGAGKGSPGAGASVTPGFVSFTGMPSTETTALGTKVSNTCATNAYCAQLVDASVSGNTIIVPYTYSGTGAGSNTAHVPTITDDKGGGSSTYTCVTEGHDSATGRFAGLCYSINASAGIRNITASFGAAVAHTAVAVMQAYNIASFDVTAGNSGTSTTTFTSGSATSTAASDYWVTLGCATGSPTNTGSFTAGSQGGITWVADLLDRRDGCAIQHGVQTSASALNPQLTISSADSFVAVSAAFKSGTSGTAPSGFYVSRIYHYNSASGGTGPYAIQVPITGNLVVVAMQGGGAGPQTVTGITDGTNTYTSCGSGVSGSLSAQTFYAANVTPGVLPMSIATTGTGDVGPAMIYDIIGAAAAQTCVRTSQIDPGSTTGNLTTVANFHPAYNPSISIGSVGFNQNTTIAVTSPATLLFDSNTYGAEVIDGPQPVDQNNGMSHINSTANGPMTWTWTLSNVTRPTGGSIAEALSFQGAGATKLPLVFQGPTAQNAATATTLAVTTAATLAGSTLVIAVANSNSRTITKICTDGTTCSAGNSFTQATSAASSSGTLRTDVWYLFNATTGTTTVTITYSATATNREAAIWEVQGLSAFDGGNALAGTVASSTITGAAVTTTSTNGFCAALTAVSNIVTASPKAGNEFIDGSGIWSNTTDAWAGLISTSAASHTPTWTNSSGTYASSTACLR